MVGVGDCTVVLCIRDELTLFILKEIERLV